jgi:tRNA G18 (ribose-2'-O)-methylase SpoU
VVERLLEDGRFGVHSVLVTPPALAALHGMLERRPDAAVYVCDPAVLRGSTGFNFHRGCLALAFRPPVAMSLPGTAACVLALEGVSNPDNVGGLFRAACAFGVDAVILDRATADPLYRKAIRTSMAATLRVPFVRVEPWHPGLLDLRSAGFCLLAMSPHPHGVTLEEYSAHADERVILLVGNEGSGLSETSLGIADVTVRIPIDPRADSLNVVTAAAIALHALRTRLE